MTPLCNTKMTKLSRYIRALSLAAVAIVGMSIMASCAEKESIQSNKRERNSIKDGNKLYDKKKYTDAIEAYDKAIEANPASDRAYFNRSLSTLMSGKADSAQLTDARIKLNELVDGSSDAEVREYALYTLGNDAVYIGDELVKQAEVSGASNPALADSLKQLSTESYKQAIQNYEELLRRKPGDARVMQNLRIAQLKLPPEQQGGGGGGSNNQNQDQQQQQQQQQQQNQQQNQQNQQQQQKKQDEALKALEMREMKTRKQQEKASQPQRHQPDKPW